MADTTLELSPDATAQEAGAAVADWIEREVPQAWLKAIRAGDLVQLRAARPTADYLAWYPTLGRTGLPAPTWPIEYGGLGLSDEAARAVVQELRNAHLPVLNVLGLGLAGPTLREHGTEDQKRSLLPGIVDNSQPWCQLFSEPGAGSDLAGLSTRAVAVDGAWQINGQKVWTSFATGAKFGMLLARTDPSLPKHAGITYFALDMESPGVTVRPLRQISGDADFNEVFLDDVIVPDSMRIGPLNAGWQVAVTTLMNERSTISGSGSGFRDRLSGRSVERLIETALAQGSESGQPLRATTRSALTQLWIDERLVEWTNLRLRTARAAGQPLGAEASVVKLFQSEHNQRVQRFAMRLLGGRAVAHAHNDRDAAAVVHGYLHSFSDTIAGGTSEIQRNILGERVLGLPREPQLDKGMAWADVPRGG
jgi:alkylation response protein AidB-like acyl-CoA dehydrogenase